MRSRTTFALGLVALLGAGCGDFVESGEEAALSTLDDQGGTLTFRSFELRLPAGAIAHTVTFRATAEPRAGLLSDAYRIEPDARVFAVAARLTITVDAPGVPPTELFLADLLHTPPQPLPGRRLEGHRLSGDTKETGTFGVIRCPGAVCPH